MKEKHQTVLTTEQLKELGGALIQAIPSDLPKDAAQHWIGRKKELAAKIREALFSINPCADIIASWEKFYNDIGYPCSDLSGVRIPVDPGGFGRVIVMAKDITLQVAYDLCYKHFDKKCWKWTDENLDKIVISDRDARNGAYAIRIRDRVEADEENSNLSYNDLKSRNIIGITLEERLIYELKYFKETGKHLDIRNVTLCTGSLYRVGFVPLVYWYRYFVRLDVLRYDPVFADEDLRSRSAVV